MKSRVIEAILCATCVLVVVTGCSKKPSTPTGQSNSPAIVNPPAADKPSPVPTKLSVNEKDRAIAENKKKLDADIERLVPKEAPEPVPTTQLGSDTIYEGFPEGYVSEVNKRGFPFINPQISRQTFGLANTILEKDPRPKTTPPEMVMGPLDDSSFANKPFPVSPVPCKLIVEGIISRKLATELLRQENVVELEFDFLKSSNNDSIEVLAGLPKLKKLTLLNIKKDDLTKAIGSCRKLKSLSIKGYFDKIHAETIAKKLDLETLAVFNYDLPLTDEAVAEICKIKSLKSLSLRSIGEGKVTSVSGVLISRLSGLEVLDLAGINSFSVDGWAAISRLTRLRKLAIPGFDSLFESYDRHKIYRTPLVIDALKPLVNLQTLVITNVHTFGNGDFAKFGQFPELETLCLTYAANMDDKMLDELSTVKSLKVLRLSSTKKITDAAVSKFKKEHPACEVHVKKSDF